LPFRFAENPEMAIDKMTDDERRAFRKQKVAELKHHAYEIGSFEAEVTAKR
jgi:hypothetical protein